MYADVNIMLGRSGFFSAICGKRAKVEFKCNIKI